MNRILISGGTGLIGRRITERFRQAGWDVVLLSRKADMVNGMKVYAWDIDKGTIDRACLEGVSAVIHLAGAGISDHRWTSEYKEQIRKSRVASTRLLVGLLAQRAHNVRVFAAASAVGYYGMDVPGVVSEHSQPGSDFLASVCRDWEREAMRAEEIGIRTVIMRTGVVLSGRGGFIPKIAGPIRWFAGAVPGSGSQVMSWIHEDDLAEAYYVAVTKTLTRGAYNAVAPHPVPMGLIMRKAARLLHRPVLLPHIPGFMLRIALGEMSGMLTGNLHASSKKLLGAGVHFAYPDIDRALEQTLRGQ